METPAIIKKHPYAIGGGVAALVLLWLYSRSSSSSGSGSTQTAVVSSGIDPTAAALTAQQMQDNAALTAASLNAQTQIAGINALQTINSNNDATQIQLASINANVTNAQTAAGIFGTAVNGLTENNAMATASSDSTAINGDYTTGIAAGSTIVPGGPGWQAWMTPFAHDGQQVPIVNTTGSTTVTNTTNNQIEELFNNVIRAGQGTAPMQTVTMQPQGETTSIGGYATLDPVFAVWNGSSGTPSITDVTLNPQSQYGYTGSVYTPGDASATNITPNAVPSAQTAQLPNLQFPNFGNFSF